MAEDRVITLRFQEWKAMDMELYRMLEEGKKERGLSMPVYVKGILRQHFGGREHGMGTDAGMDACMERLREIVHGELASQSDMIAGMLERITEGFPEGAGRTGQTDGLPESAEMLPGYSDSFPEGFDSILEKFM